MVFSSSSTRVAVSLALSALSVRAAVSTYDFPVARPTPGHVYDGWEAYDPHQPVPEPAAPVPLPLLDFPVSLDYSGNAVGAGIPVKGSFMGISIEMSLAEAIIGRNSSWMRPQFLNLMSTLHQRGGPPVLRCGGNSQEKAYLVDSIEGGLHSTERQIIGVRTPTNTPTLLYTKDIFEAMRTASDLLGIHWYLGLPMNQTEPARLEIAEVAEPMLGEYLLSWHLGNEPDLYNNHQARPDGYDEAAYMAEYASIIAQMRDNPKIQNRPILGGPSFCECGTPWSNADVIDNMNWLNQFREAVNTLIVMHYPTDNCPDKQGNYKSAEEIEALTLRYFNEFSHHEGNDRSVKHFASLYTRMTEISAINNIPLVLLETNTASCNGFLGLSDSFLGALWNLDLGMQLASSGFSHMMVHLGGQRSYYNPFMSPPWNATEPFMWTVMAPFYAVLVSSEALGPSGNARVVDMGVNNNHTQMVGYTIFENNQPVRLVLINYMSDGGAGTLTYTARVAAQGVSRVRVRYLTAKKITDKFGITYAGQGFGGYFESDGLLKGEQKTEEVSCVEGSCAIKVPAPGAAVVFLTDDLIFDASAGDEVTTFATSATTKMLNTAAVPGDVLATANGISGDLRSQMQDAKTSRGDGKNAASSRATAWTVISVIAACAAGVWAVMA